MNQEQFIQELHENLTFIGTDESITIDSEEFFDNLLGELREKANELRKEIFHESIYNYKNKDSELKKNMEDEYIRSKVSELRDIIYKIEVAEHISSLMVLFDYEGKMNLRTGKYEFTKSDGGEII